MAAVFLGSPKGKKASLLEKVNHKKKALLGRVSSCLLPAHPLAGPPSPGFS